MTNKFHAISRFLSAALVFIFFIAGCHSVKTVRMYDGPDVPADQQVTLVVPWCISLQTVDGLPAPFTLTDELRLLLRPGTHTLKACYTVLYPTSQSNSEKITSDYITLTFIGKAGKTYTICSKDPITLEATREYAAHVSLWIEESVTGSVKGAAIKTPVRPAAMSTNATAEIISSTPKNENPEIQEQLQANWEKASEQDRKVFLDKIQRQSR